MELLTLGLGIGAGALAARGVAALREHRPAPAGLADVLQWAFLVDGPEHGVILQKDGSLVAGWRFRGPDLGSATPAELDALGAHVNAALLPLAGGWMLHVDAVRRPARPYADGRFPDPVTQLLDDERRAAYDRAAGRQFETEHVVVVTHVPPAELTSRAAGFFVQADGVSGGAGEWTGRRGVAWATVLGGFATSLAQLQDRLGGRLALERLGSDALCTHMHECLTGLPHRVLAPAHGSYLNAVLASQDFVGGFAPRVGERHLRLVAVQGYPAASHAGMLDVLTRLPMAYRWSSRVIPLARADAAGLIRRQQLQWFRKRKGAGALAAEMASRGPAGGSPRGAQPDDDVWLDQDARAMTRDAQDAAAANESGAVRFCLHTQVVVVSDPDAERADALAREVARVLGDAGFAGRIETVNAVEAFLGSLPGHGHPNLRRPPVSSRAAADLLPLTGVWPGLATNPSPYFPPDSPPLLWAKTDGATPFRLNLHVSDVGHALVLGPTGSGKSTLLATLASQFLRYDRAQVFFFDVGHSAWALAAAMEASHPGAARHYDLAAGRPDALQFQPLARVDDAAERAWAAEWLEGIAELQGVRVTPPLRARIDRALALLALDPPAHRTLSELLVHLQQPDLVAAIRPYTVAGHYGALLDADRDDLADGAFQVFELKHLLDIDDRVVVPVLGYLLRRVEQRLDGRPTLVVIDEAWQALMHTAFGARVSAWLLQLRKRNGAVVLATQSLSQLARLPNRHVILDSTPTKIFLAHPDAEAPGVAELYADAGLNAREVALVAAAEPKRHYYYRSPRGARRFELGLGPVALSFLAPPAGVAPAEWRRHLERLAARHGDAWPAAWLRERGLDAWADQLLPAPAPVPDSAAAPAVVPLADTTVPPRPAPRPFPGSSPRSAPRSDPRSEAPARHAV